MVAHTRLLSVGFQSWSQFLVVSLQVMWVINLAVGCHYFPPGPSVPESSTLTTRLSSHPMFKDICDFLCLERQQRPMGRGIKWLHKIIQQLLPSMHEISRVQLCGTRTAPGSRRCMRQMPLQSESVQYTAPLHCDLVTHTHARTHAHTHKYEQVLGIYRATVP